MATIHRPLSDDGLTSSPFDMIKPVLSTVAARVGFACAMACVAFAWLFPPQLASQHVSENTSLSFETEQFAALVSPKNGGLQSFKLKEPRYHRDDQQLDMVTTDRGEFLPLNFTLEGVELGSAPQWESAPLAEPGQRGVRLTWEGDGVRVVRKYQAGAGPYQVWVTTRVENLGDAPREVALSTSTYHYALRADEESGVPLLPMRSPWVSHGLCYHGDEDLEREDRSSLTEESAKFTNVRFAGVENVYFLSAISAVDGLAAGCTLQASDRGRNENGDPLGTLFTTTLQYEKLTAEPGKSVQFRSLAYLGPKTPEDLAAAGHHFSESIDGGWFSTLASLLTELLRLIHDFTGNWGVAIILLTFVVKLALYPLTAKQMKSMARMKELKPEMDRINELYADDREKKGAAMMELYREKGVSPMSGCLPMLVQLPVWFSLYTSLLSNIELFHADFALWLTDLSSPDPYFVLPLVLGALYFLQQKMTPTTGGDPVQQKTMLYMMPTMMTAFMIFFPAGLGIYMVTNTALTLTQQKLIEAQIGKSPPAAADSEGMAAGSSSNPLPATGASTGDTARRFRTARPSKAERRSRRGK